MVIIIAFIFAGIFGAFMQQGALVEGLPVLTAIFATSISDTTIASAYT